MIALALRLFPAIAAASFVSLSPPASAQIVGQIVGQAQEAAEGPRSVSSLLADWRVEHGASWDAAVNAETGQAELLFGGHAAPPFEPSTNRQADWFALGRHWIEATLPMHATRSADLLDDKFVYLPLGQVGTTDKITVRFLQEFGGVPVEDGSMNVLFDTNGRLLSLHVKTAPSEVRTAGSQPTIDAGFASLVARETFHRTIGAIPNVLEKPTLMFAWWNDGAVKRWSLAWRVNAQHHVDGDSPRGHYYTIDAHTGKVLKTEDSVHHFDVTGTITTFATPGIDPDMPSNPTVEVPMPRVEIQTSAGTFLTDANGQFTIPGVNVPIDITVTYNGPFSATSSLQGQDFTQTFQAVPPATQNALVLNTAPTEYATAQANAFVNMNILRNWIRERVPTDDTADFAAVADCNESSSCNAYFDGSRTVYFNETSQCNNTAYSTVVAHEMGHWLNVLYGTGNGSDGMGEGNADTFALYLYDTPLLAANFFTNGNGLRDGTNTVQFCGDSSPNCHGGVHDSGQVWMGAAWKVRRNLNTSLGDALGDMTADLLFLGWMNSFDQTQIRSIIETQWLTLDDDDGDISNGTPNYVDIDGGFREQGFPGYGLRGVDFANVTAIDDQEATGAPYDVIGTLTPAINTQVVSADLIYRLDGGPWITNAMTFIGNNVWRGQIPTQPSPTRVDYYLRGFDDLGLPGEFPSDGAMMPLMFRVGRIVSFLTNDFEQANYAPWSAGAPFDTATAGLWTLGDPVGTGAQPERDHSDPGTDCWFTGQGTAGGADDAADVDGGQTTLTSGLFQTSGASDPLISYWRWYSNGGGVPTDVLTVEISADAGTTWVPVETVGPMGPEAQGSWFFHEFRISDFVTPSKTMLLRFIAADLGSPSIVEAAIDDIRGASFEFSAEDAPRSFCSSTVNTLGARAQIGFAGSPEIATDTFAVTATGIQANATVVFIMSPEPNHVTFAGGDGFLCVGGQIRRIGAAAADPFFQVAALPMNFSQPMGAIRLIDPGTTWFFQGWYRDVTANGHNTTDGLRVTFR